MMARSGKQVGFAIANQIEKLNGWLYRCIVQNDKRLEVMGVDKVVARSKDCLQEFFACEL